MNLKAEDTMSIGTTFSDNQYCISIPLNQRKFDWMPEQVEEFWNDFRKMLNGESHYFGVLSFVVADDHINRSRPRKSLLVVTDGQQRLLTTSLLIAAIRDAYFALDEKEEAERIHKNFFITERVRDQFQKISVSTIDTETYRQIVNAHTQRGSKIELKQDSAIKLEENKNRKVSRTTSNFINEKIVDTYDYFYNEIITELLKRETHKERMDWLELVEKKLDETNVIWITSEDPDFLYLFFETLNNRGLKLNQMDIIRNKLLDITAALSEKEVEKGTSAEEVFEVVNSKVEEISELWDQLVIILADLDITKYLKYYYMCAEERILSGNKLPSNYEKFFKGKSNYVELKKEIEKMIKYGVFFSFFHNPEKDGLDNKTSNLNIVNINSFKQQASYSFLMDYYYHINSQDRRDKLTKLIEVLMFRRVICSSSTKELDKIFLEMINTRENNDGSSDYDDEELLKIIEKYLPSDDNFNFNFKTRHWDRDAITNYVLRQYEYEIMAVEVEISKKIKDRKEVHIEHIAPDSPTPEWLTYYNVDVNEYNKLSGNLGNLILLKKELNLQAKQKQFNLKKDEHYKDSELEQVKEVCSNTSWSKKVIKDRNNKILNTCYYKWKI